MARILVGSEWYEQLASDAFLEGEFERFILSRAELIFPAFYPVKFNKLIQYEDGLKKPDFALIDKEYGSWWVVEVELAHHSLWGHVIPQIAVFSRASFGSEDASYLERQRPDLDGTKLREMMKGEPPRILVIVNQPRPDWQFPLAGYNASLAVAEIFRSDLQKHIVRLNGDYPRIVHADDVLSLCVFDPQVGRFLIIRSPARLETPESGRLEIEFEGSVTEWVRMSLADRVWLSPAGGRNPLPQGHQYELVRIEDERLLFRVAIQREGE